MSEITPTTRPAAPAPRVQTAPAAASPATPSAPAAPTDRVTLGEARETPPPTREQMLAAFRAGSLAVDVARLNSALDRQAMLLPGVGLPDPDAQAVAELFRDRPEASRQELVRAFEGQGKNLGALLGERFEAAPAAELKGLVEKGHLSAAEEIFTALESGDSEDVRVSRALDRKTPAQVQQIREEYRSRFGRDLDEHVTGELSGLSEQRARRMLLGEPTADPALADPQAREQDRLKRLGTHLTDLVVGDLGGSAEPFMASWQNTRQLLDDLHGRTPSELRALEQSFAERTGESLREVLENRLSGSDEKMALAYLRDGREDAQEKLDRAVTGKNDMQLIRTTLREASAQERQVVAANPVLLERLRDDLGSEEFREVEGLLDDGRLNARERVDVAVTDGDSDKILDSVVGLSAEDRLQVQSDAALRARARRELSDSEFATFESLLEGGREPLERRLDRVEDQAGLVALLESSTPEERRQLAGDGDLKRKAFESRIDEDKLALLLRPEAPALRERLLVESDETVLLGRLRQAQGEQLSGLRGDGELLSHLEDRLDDSQYQEARRLLETSGRLPASEALDLALRQEDGPRVLELLKSVRSQGAQAELVSRYQAAYGTALQPALREALSSRDEREAEALLRAPASGEGQLQARVAGDLLRERDDQEVFASASNRILDVFSDAGRNLDDAAREIRARQPSAPPPATAEERFQTRREELQVARKELADTLSDVATGAFAALITATTMGAGGGCLGAFLRGGSWLARTTAVGSVGGGTQLLIEKTLRGNDLDLEEEGLKVFGKGFATAAGANLAGRVGNLVATPGAAAASRSLHLAREGFSSAVGNFTEEFAGQAFAVGAGSRSLEEILGRAGTAAGIGGALGTAAAPTEWLQGTARKIWGATGYGLEELADKAAHAWLD